MSTYVAVVDYGMGNLRSVEKALQAVGAKTRITNSAGVVRQAAAVVVPGVGAFGQAVHRLKQKGLFGPLRDCLNHNKPFLGICLGLQMLFEKSEESPGVRGFGFLKGAVVRFKEAYQSKIKVPHMGWNTLSRGQAGDSLCLKGVAAGDRFYFVHSYFPVPQDKSWVAASTFYGTTFCSAVSHGRLFASQFHPEKSGDKGLHILRNFVRALRKEKP